MSVNPEWTIKQPWQVNPLVAAEPPCEARGGPADGLKLKCPEGFVVTLSRKPQFREIACVALPLFDDVFKAWSGTAVGFTKSLGSYAGHYVRVGDHLEYRND